MEKLRGTSTYEWEETTGKTDVQWVADDTDFPTVNVTGAEHDKRPFIVLSGHYDWNDATDNSDRTRGIRTHLYARLVNTTDLAAALAELEGRDLLGHDISNPPQTHGGYVGEFPYGHHHGATIHVISHETHEPLSVPTQPASWDILGEYEYAPGDHGTISLDAPAPEFFGPAPGNLNWNGRNGWTDTTGRLIALLRHSVNVGQNELLIDAGWLERWLIAEQKSLIWIENTGKFVYRGISRGGSYPGQLYRSQVHAWTPGSDVRQAEPGWDRVPAHGE